MRRLWDRIVEMLWWVFLAQRALARRLVSDVQAVAEERRVLGIFHFQEHGAYLGDMVEFLAILNVLRARHSLQKVDLCYVDDPTNPNQPVTRHRIDSSASYKEMMLDLRALLPCVGEVFHFNADRDFELFFRANYRRYVCWPRYRYLHSWPSRVNYNRMSTRGIAYPNTYAPLYRYFDAHGDLPHLTCPPDALEWANSLVRTHVSPAVPVAVQIRFNADSPYRNTDLDAWHEFFARMETHGPVKFVLISRREEIVPKLRELKNIVYAKDHDSNVLQDLAMVQVAHFSMFTDSGFSIYPWFCGLPTVAFGKNKNEFPLARMQDETGQSIRFLSSFQRRFWGDYRADDLVAGFLSLWNDLAATGWTNPYRDDPTRRT